MKSYCEMMCRQCAKARKVLCLTDEGLEKIEACDALRFGVPELCPYFEEYEDW